MPLKRLNLPQPEGRLDVERLLYVPQGTKRVVLNGLSFTLMPGDSLAVIGNSGAGKTTLGKNAGWFLSCQIQVMSALI